MAAQIELDGRRWRIDLAHGTSLARELRFDAAALRCFGTPAPHSAPCAVGGFTGRVGSGGSCNCSTITLTPHGNGTHTESVGHLTAEILDVQDIAPRELLPALLVTVTPERAEHCAESSDPAPAPADLLITRQALERTWRTLQAAAPAARALIVRTLPNDPDRWLQAPEHAAFLSREAAQWLVARGIEHLVLDVPSADRAEDHGRLTAHRIFFGLPGASTRLTEATRRHATITELAFIADDATDGAYLLSLQLPAIAGDAVPSRPLLYALQPLDTGIAS